MLFSFLLFMSDYNDDLSKEGNSTFRVIRSEITQCKGCDGEKEVFEKLFHSTESVFLCSNVAEIFVLEEIFLKSSKLE